MKDQPAAQPAFYTEAEASLAELEALTAQTTNPADVLFAAEVTRNVPVYDTGGLAETLAGPDRAELLAEWAHVFLAGPGILVLKAAYADTGVIDAASAIYENIIADEKIQGAGGGDHFAKPGANDRVWNALQKLGQADPAIFARYFGNPALASVFEAWCGPGYQVTAQINLVHPGGAAQEAHRDYHLGFMSADHAARFPAHAHHLSPMLTLQGAIAHCDMPVESGPTKLLPFSQQFGAGYAAYRRPDIRAHFDAHHIQLPLAKGDAVFFNPAVFHAAGDNRSADIERMANLLQISSPMGRAIEAIDRQSLSRALYPALQVAKETGEMSDAEISAAIAAAAEGYPFPTNLDTDPPVGGLAPKSMAVLMQEALAEGQSVEEFSQTL